MNSIPIEPANGTTHTWVTYLARSKSIVLLLVLICSLPLLQRYIGPSFVYGGMTVTLGSEMTLSVFTPGARDGEQCQTQLDNLKATFQVTCPTCSVQSSFCSAQVSETALNALGFDPLPVPSVRLPGGGVLQYISSDPAFALMACKETQRQSTGIECFSPNVARTLGGQSSKEEWQKVYWATGFYDWLLVALGVFTLTVLYAGTVRNRLAVKKGVLVPTSVWIPKLFMAGFDAFWLVAAYLALGIPNDENIAMLLRYDARQAFIHLSLVAITVLCFWIYFEQYARRRPLWDELREIFRTVLLALLLAGAALFYAGLDAGRELILWTWASIFVLLPVGRSAARHLLLMAGLWLRPVYIVGTGTNAVDAYKAMTNEPSMGYKVIGFIRPTQVEQVPPALDGIQIKGETLKVHSLGPDLKLSLKALGNPELVVALESLSNTAAQQLLQRLIALNQNIHVIPSIRGLPLFGATLSHFFSHETLFLTVRNNLSRRGYRAVKRLFDIILASLLIVLLCPLMSYVAWRIWREDGGPVIFSQPRVAHGRPGTFKFYKFRSMVNNADGILREWQQGDTPEWKAYCANNFKLPQDPRVLKIGRLIRSTSMDELPQLFNVLKGDMSLVGPRPLLERELDQYGENIELYRQARPGITGLWQVSGRSQTKFIDRVALDQWYVQNWSMWYDVIILLKTVQVVFRRQGAY